MLPSDTAKTWELIAPVIPRAAYLVGGTAIAVHLHHRVSRDLDFFYHRNEIDLDKLAEALQSAGDFVVTSRSPGTLNGLFSETKIQVLHADEERPQRVLEPPSDQHGLRVAGLGDLLAIKMKLLADRGELRDYFDLKCIEEQGNRTLEEGLQLYADRYQPPDNASYEAIRRALGYFDDVEDDLQLRVPRKEIEAWFGRRQAEVVRWLSIGGVPSPISRT